MKKYRKVPELHVIFLPGIGRVADSRLLEGNLQQYVPSMLNEVEVETTTEIETTTTHFDEAPITSKTPKRPGRKAKVQKS